METILIIEDDDLIRENMVELFINEGYHTIAASNGRLGLEEAKNKILDLIISDIMMPEMDGIEVYKNIRSEPILSAIPFLFVSALSEISNVRSGMVLGVDDYITKPFLNSELITVVKNRIEKSRNLRKSLEDLKSNLIRSVPHEFLTPLNAVIGFSQLLMDGCGELHKDEIYEYSHYIFSAGQRLLRITRNYILFTDLTMNEKEYKTRASLENEIYENIEYFLSEYLYEIANNENRRQDLNLKLEPANLRISDKNLRKILEELLDNAIKFSKKNINITGQYVNGEYEIMIQDDGDGISMTNLQNIEAFMQFDRKMLEQQGLGLGLAIVKKLSSISKCRFHIESVVGQGTKAFLYIPLAKNEQG
ncbi:MAG TPA: response regulator [Leptospiraceae bacterium]|nr:response regulator [Leptospiraceae bacterium]